MSTPDSGRTADDRVDRVITEFGQRLNKIENLGIESSKTLASLDTFMRQHAHGQQQANREFREAISKHTDEIADLNVRHERLLHQMPPASVPRDQLNEWRANVESEQKQLIQKLDSQGEKLIKAQMDMKVFTVIAGAIFTVIQAVVVALIVWWVKGAMG